MSNDVLRVTIKKQTLLVENPLSRPRPTQSLRQRPEFEQTQEREFGAGGEWVPGGVLRMSFASRIRQHASSS